MLCSHVSLCTCVLPDHRGQKRALDPWNCSRGCLWGTTWVPRTESSKNTMCHLPRLHSSLKIQLQDTRGHNTRERESNTIGRVPYHCLEINIRGEPTSPLNCPDPQFSNSIANRNPPCPYNVFNWSTQEIWTLEWLAQAELNGSPSAPQGIWLAIL